MSPDSESRAQRQDLEEALAGGPEALRAFLEEAHPADLAEWIDELEEADAHTVLDCLAVEDQAELLRFAEDAVAEDLLKLLSIPRLVKIVEELPADEVVDLLALADDDKAEAVLRQVDLDRAKGLRELLAYDAETAGGVMNSEYVTVSSDAHVGDAIKEIRSEAGPAGEEEVGVFVVDDKGRPVGFVSDRELLTTPIHTPIGEIMEADLVLAHADDDQEDAANQVSKYNLSALGVVDDDGVLIGVISAEDAHDVLQEEAEEDIYRLVGASHEDPTRLPVWTRVRHRLPLQVLTVAGGLVTATILKAAAGPEPGGVGMMHILRFVPIIIGLAGNVGIQSSTILVRAFATGEVSRDRESSVLATEVLTGFLIGLICGAVTLAVATWMESPADNALGIGVALGTAIVVAVTWAAFLGCLVPMCCQRWGIDPAIVAGPFLIVLSDVSGSAIFVTIAGAMVAGLGS